MVLTGLGGRISEILPLGLLQVVGLKELGPGVGLAEAEFVAAKYSADKNMRIVQVGVVMSYNWSQKSRLSYPT
jgi:hypothetical protein